jgi:hypothetical protein
MSNPSSVREIERRLKEIVEFFGLNAAIACVNQSLKDSRRRASGDPSNDLAVQFWSAAITVFAAECCLHICQWCGFIEIDESDHEPCRFESFAMAAPAEGRAADEGND